MKLGDALRTYTPSYGLNGYFGYRLRITHDHVHPCPLRYRDGDIRALAIPIE